MYTVLKRLVDVNFPGAPKFDRHLYLQFIIPW